MVPRGNGRGLAVPFHEGAGVVAVQDAAVQPDERVENLEGGAGRKAGFAQGFVEDRIAVGPFVIHDECTVKPLEDIRQIVLLDGFRRPRHGGEQHEREEDAYDGVFFHIAFIKRKPPVVSFGGGVEGALGQRYPSCSDDHGLM